MDTRRNQVKWFTYLGGVILHNTHNELNIKWHKYGNWCSLGNENSQEVKGAKRIDQGDGVWDVGAVCTPVRLGNFEKKNDESDDKYLDNSVEKNV